MANFNVNYLGLHLRNPIIIASSGLTNSVEKNIDLFEKGAGAIVLKSLFEEQILAESAHNISLDQSYGYDVHDYISNTLRNVRISDYLRLIKETKLAVDIPVIASINCVTDREWVEFTQQIEDAGADALEINIGILPSNHNISSEQNEQNYFNILKKVRRNTKLPVAVKLSNYSAGLAHLIKKLSWTGYVDGFVLFNRYYRPNLDIETMKVTSSDLFSNSSDISESLRWVAIMSKAIELPISATTGVHSGADVIKQILAGANSVQIASAIYKNGSSHIQTMLKDMESWMDRKSYKNLDEFRGKMSFDVNSNTVAFERIQFMKHFGTIE
jgi:dihydroorotate dehydrogenase (fumarate)